MENIIRITEGALREAKFKVLRLENEKTDALNKAICMQNEINVRQQENGKLENELSKLLNSNKDVEPSEDFKYLTQASVGSCDAQVKRGPKPLQNFQPDYLQ